MVQYFNILSSRNHQGYEYEYLRVRSSGAPTYVSFAICVMGYAVGVQPTEISNKPMAKNDGNLVVT